MFRILLALFFINVSFGQQIDKVDFIKCNASVSPNPAEKSISGTVVYEFKLKKQSILLKLMLKAWSFQEL